MSGIVGMLSGAPSAASTAGGYYQNAANELANEYGSPAAQMFGKEQMASLRPLFNQQTQALTGDLAAQGIAPSGAGRAAFGNLAANQSATLAGSVAPLYQQALGQYGNIIGQMPGSQVNAYQDAINNFYQAVSMAGEAAGGMPPSANPQQTATQGANSAANWEFSGAPGSISAPNYYGSGSGAPDESNFTSIYG